MLNDLAVMQECQDLTWCRSAIWSWLSLAAQQSVMRSSIAQDEMLQKPCDEVCLAEHAIEGSSRAALFMKQKIYKLITGMRRLPEYGDVDWEDILPREKAATEDINQHVRMLQKGPVVEHEEVVEALRTAADEPSEPLPPPYSETDPRSEGAGGSSTLRNLISGLDDSGVESLRSLSEDPPEYSSLYPNGPPPGPQPEPRPPSNPEPPASPGAPGSPQPTMQPKPPISMDATKVSRVTRALNKISSKLKNVLESMKNVFRRASKPQPKEPAQPEPPRTRPLTRDPLKPQAGSSKASRPPPKLESKPQVTNPGDYMDDFHWGNLEAKGFNTLDDLPKGPAGVKLDKASKGLSLGGFGEKKLDPNEFLTEEQFDSKRGTLTPSNNKVDVPVNDSEEWTEESIEAYNREWLQHQGLIKNLEPGEIGEPGSWVVQSWQALRPANDDLSKGKWKAVENAAVDCATARKRSAAFQKRGCLTAPSGLAALKMDALPVLDTFGQPLISTVGADDIRTMQGVRATSDGVYHLLDDAGDIAKDSGSLAWDAVTRLLTWAAPHHGGHKGGHKGGHNQEQSTKSAKISSDHQATLQTVQSTTGRRPTDDAGTETTRSAESTSLPSTTSQNGAATTMSRPTGNSSTSTTTSQALPIATPSTGNDTHIQTNSTSTSPFSATSQSLPLSTSSGFKSDNRTSTTTSTSKIASSRPSNNTRPSLIRTGGGPILLPPRPTNTALVIEPIEAFPTPQPSHTPASLNCPWQSHPLRPYEVWSNPSLPPGCSSPIFYECTPNFHTYTGCTNARACKKHRKHNPTKQCPNKPFSNLSPNYFNHLGRKTSQKGCVWNRTLRMGMVWSLPNLAPGCSEPVLWECTVDWQRWFYKGSGLEEWKWKRPGYCFDRDSVRGHDEAVVMGCGYGFEGVGCREKYLAV